MSLHRDHLEDDRSSASVFWRRDDRRFACVRGGAHPLKTCARNAEARPCSARCRDRETGSDRGLSGRSRVDIGTRDRPIHAASPAPYRSYSNGRGAARRAPLARFSASILSVDPKHSVFKANLLKNII